MSGTLYTKSRRFYSTSNDVKGMREHAYINTLSPSYLEIQYILNSNLHSFNKQKKILKRKLENIVGLSYII